MDTTENKQPKLFATWLRPIEIKLDRDSLSSRWKSVSRLVESIEYNKAINLVRYIFDEPYTDELLEWFQVEFQNDDELFTMIESENHNELQILAGIVIILKLKQCNEISSDIGNYILAAYCSGLKPLNTRLPIIESAIECTKQHSIKSRIKPKKTATYKNWEPKKISEAISKIEYSDTESIMNAISVVGNVAKDTFNSLKVNNNNLNKIITAQDEELNILWWLINGYSECYKLKFEDINENERAIVLGVEISNLIELNTEIPSIRGVLHRAGIEVSDDDNKISLEDIVNCITKPSELFSDSLILDKIQTPLLFSIEKRMTLGNDGWYEKLKNILNFDENDGLSAIEWSIQICRELLSLKSKLACYE